MLINVLQDGECYFQNVQTTSLLVPAYLATRGILLICATFHVGIFEFKNSTISTVGGVNIVEELALAVHY